MKQLIDKYANSTQEEKNKFLDSLQDFSNAPPLTVHRQAATYIKGIFRANRNRLELYVDSHFAHKTTRISEGILAKLVSELEEQQSLLCEFLAYGAERVAALSLTPLSLWTPTEHHWIINIQAKTAKTKIEHPCILPKALGDRVRKNAIQHGYTCPFPNYKTIGHEITLITKQRYQIRLTLHYFRKRFATIADKTLMSPNDWDFLMGSKQDTGHEASIYQLDDITALETAYSKYLEPFLAFGANTPTKETLQSEHTKELEHHLQTMSAENTFLKQQIAQKDAIIQSLLTQLQSQHIAQTKQTRDPITS